LNRSAASASACKFGLGLFLTLAFSCAAAPWKRHIIDDSSRGADGVRLADINGDGLSDITTGWEQGGTVRVYLNPGHAKSREKWPAVTVGRAPNVEDAVFVDLDGDGSVDVVSSTEGATRTLFVHWAPRDRARMLEANAWQTIALPAAEKKAMWMFCAPSQIDGRNGIDLFAVSKGKPGQGVIGWLESPANPRDLSQWTWHLLRPAGWVMGVEASDMDGDGDEDVVISQRLDEARSGCFWLENPGGGSVRSATWKEHAIGVMGQNALFFCLTDLDGDGLQDVCVGTHGAAGDDEANAIHFLRRLDRSGKRWAERKIDFPQGSALFKAVSAGDINGDGRTDLVASFVKAQGKPGLLWLSHDGSAFKGRWTAHELSGVDGVKHDLVALVDLDGDGDLDAITTEEVANRGVIWYENPTRQAR
jgi:hypothetical protein